MGSLLLLLGSLIIIMYILFSNRDEMLESMPKLGICYQRYFSNVDPGIAGDMAAYDNWSKIRPRGDISLFKNMNISTIRLYEWNYTASHTAFIKDMCFGGMQFQLPISNYLLGWAGAAGRIDVDNMYRTALKEVTLGSKYVRCINSIAISNEPDLQGDPNWEQKIAVAVNAILNAERDAGIIGELPPIVVPCSFANYGQGPGIDSAIKLNSLPIIKSLGDRFIYAINTTNGADDVKNLFAIKYNKPFMITEWGLDPRVYGDRYSQALETETKKLLSYAQDIKLVDVYAFLYFKQVHKTGNELYYGFTCFPEYKNISNCLTNNSCPPQGAKLGINPNNNSLEALARAYGGTSTGIDIYEC